MISKVMQSLKKLLAHWFQEDSERALGVIQLNNIFNVRSEKNHKSVSNQCDYLTEGKEDKEQLIEFNISNLEDVENFWF